jgi:2',3'-cyclic-nucleotide 2'-phosphodiesterase (5'-nucleotidase family)
MTHARTRILTITALTLVLGVTVSLHAAGEAEAEGDRSTKTEIVIAYTSSLNGNIEGCDCKSHPRAGLAKSAVLLRRVKDQGGLLVDCGDLLPPENDIDLAEALFSAYADVGYDVISFGDQELGIGAAPFLDLLPKTPLFLSMNLNISPDGFAQPSRIKTFPGYRVFSSSGVRTGIGSVIDPPGFPLYPKEIKGTIRISDPVSAAASILDSMIDEGCAVRILRFHGSIDAAMALIRAVPGFTAVIVGHEQRLIEEYTGQTLLLSPGEEGNRVGLLRIAINGRGAVASLSNSFTLFSYENDPDDPAVKKLSQEYLDKLQGLIRTAPAGN